MYARGEILRCAQNDKGDGLVLFSHISGLISVALGVKVEGRRSILVAGAPAVPCPENYNYELGWFSGSVVLLRSVVGNMLLLT